MTREDDEGEEDSAALNENTRAYGRPRLYVCEDLPILARGITPYGSMIAVAAERMLYYFDPARQLVNQELPS